MLWIPLILLLAALCLSDILRQFGRPATGPASLVLGLAFAVGAIGLVFALMGSFDLGTAEHALEWVRTGVAAQPALVTTLLAVAGLVLMLSGAGRLVDRVALADPDGPLPNTAGPGLACGLGLLLLIATYMRL
jgi:hypothetical protein